MKKVLERYEIENAKPIELPLVEHFRLSKTISSKSEMEAQEIERVPYISGVGSIMYSMVCCRLDIAHAVSQVSRFIA